MEEMNDQGFSSAHRDIWIPLRMKDIPLEKMKRVKSMLDQIPNLPVSMHRIIQMTSDSTTSPKEIAEIASSDPVLVSNILMIVNSSYYGLSRKIDNIRLAIVLLGFKEVRSIAIRCGFSRVLKHLGGHGVYDTSNLWKHSYLVSQCTEYFAGEDNPQRAGTLLTLGLLHDIGKFSLYAVGLIMKQRGMKPVRAGTVPPDAHILEKEERMFGVNHSIVGGLLAQRWTLPERICVVIECHHYPSFFGENEIPPEYLEDIAIICISDLIVNRVENPAGRLMYPHPYFFTMLGLDPDPDCAVPFELAQKLKQAGRFLGDFE